MLSISSPNASSLLFSTLLSSDARLQAIPQCVTLTGVSGRLEPGTTAPRWGLRDIKSLGGGQAKGLSELSHLLMALLWPPSYAAPVASPLLLAGWKILRAAPPCAIPYSNSPSPLLIGPPAAKNTPNTWHTMYACIPHLSKYMPTCLPNNSYTHESRCSFLHRALSREVASTCQSKGRSQPRSSQLLVNKPPS